MARAAWKQLRQDVLAELCGPSVAPLALVQRTAAAVQCMERAERAHREAAKLGVFQHAKLASILDLKGQHLEAQAVLDGLKLEAAAPGQSAAISFLKELVDRHVKWQEERTRLVSAQDGKMRQKPVEILSADSTYEEVWQRFVEPGIPCVLRGVKLAPFQSLKDVVATIGQVKIPLRRCDESSTNWARLEFDRVVKFEEFVEAWIEPYQNGLQAPRDSPQLFDFSIWQQCAEHLGHQLLMPSRWFPVDLYSYVCKQMQPISGSAAPTLFVAPGGSGSSLHVDTLQTNFWMCMCLGKKRWRLVSRDEISMLRPQYLCNLNPVFPADLNVDHGVTIYETVLEAGDLIFVPGGWPHQVENLEMSVAMSANFIDSSNVTGCIADAEIGGLVEENPALWAKALRTAVQQELPRQLLSSAQSRETLREFKARHGEPRAPYEIQRRLLHASAMTLGMGGLLCLVLSWQKWKPRSESLELRPRSTL